ncbi:Arc family DNA-binding protein [Roseococcus sp. YIM B11640]|uniref:Arc family DNA-binding protein n=1 Tax=Roseococcus sp. YIM B11640 TaxID=3133973 RepID=UPI003C7AA545
MSDDGQMRFSLRLSDDLHQKIVQAAGHAGRSVNSEMLNRLERSFEAADLSVVVAVLTKMAARLTNIEEAMDRMQAQLLPDYFKSPEEAVAELLDEIKAATGEPATPEVEDRIRRMVGKDKLAPQEIETIYRAATRELGERSVGSSAPPGRELDSRIQRILRSRMTKRDMPAGLTIFDIDEMIFEGVALLLDEAEQDPELAANLRNIYTPSKSAASTRKSHLKV